MPHYQGSLISVSINHQITHYLGFVANLKFVPYEAE